MSSLITDPIVSFGKVICTSYEIPNKKLVFTVGDNWYIKFDGNLYLTEVRILDVTELTVFVNCVQNSVYSPKRYLKNDINFIEKCN